MLRVLMNKVDNKQEQMDKGSRGWKFYERSKINTENTKQHNRKKSNVYERVISRLHTAEEYSLNLRISNQKHQKVRGKEKIKRKRSQELWDNYKKYNITNGTVRRKRERKGDI